MPSVRMPDGKLARFPDTMSVDEIQSAITAAYPSAAPKSTEPTSWYGKAAKWAGETAADAVTGASNLATTAGAPVLAAAGAAGSYLVPYTGEGSFGDRWRNEMKTLRDRNTEAFSRSPVVAPSAAVVGPTLMAAGPVASGLNKVMGSIPEAAGALRLPLSMAGGYTAAGLGNAAASAATVADKGGRAMLAAAAEGANSPWNLMGAMAPAAVAAAPGIEEIAQSIGRKAGRSTVRGGSRNLTTKKGIGVDKHGNDTGAIDEAYDAGAFKPLGTTEYAAEKIQSARDELGDKIGQTLDGASDAGAKVDTTVLARAMRAKGKRVARNLSGSVSGNIGNLYERNAAHVEQMGGGEPASMVEAQDVSFQPRQGTLGLPEETSVGVVGGEFTPAPPKLKRGPKGEVYVTQEVDGATVKNTIQPEAMQHSGALQRRLERALAQEQAARAATNRVREYAATKAHDVEQAKARVEWANTEYDRLKRDLHMPEAERQRQIQEIAKIADDANLVLSGAEATSAGAQQRVLGFEQSAADLAQGNQGLAAEASAAAQAARDVEGYRPDGAIVDRSKIPAGEQRPLPDHRASGTNRPQPMEAPWKPLLEDQRDLFTPVEGHQQQITEGRGAERVTYEPVYGTTLDADPTQPVGYKAVRSEYQGEGAVPGPYRLVKSRAVHGSVPVKQNENWKRAEQAQANYANVGGDTVTNAAHKDIARLHRLASEKALMQTPDVPGVGEFKSDKARLGRLIEVGNAANRGVQANLNKHQYLTPFNVAAAVTAPTHGAAVGRAAAMHLMNKRLSSTAAWGGYKARDAMRVLESLPPELIQQWALSAALAAEQRDNAVNR